MNGYDDTLEYLFGLERFGMVFGLENIKHILSSIGNPHLHLKAIHIAGTNGKGSVAAIISAILKEAGYRVGRYTSPHLHSFTERIVIDGERIKEEEVVELTDIIRARLDGKGRVGHFTFFDFTTAMAFEYFFQKGVDIAVIETGLGGRLDSTNVLDPLVSVITNVSFDHMDYLGKTIKAIAYEKAGIIKQGRPVVSSASGRARGIIKGVAGERNSPLFEIGRDFGYKATGLQTISYRGINRRIDNLFINLMGEHQFVNSACSICAIEVLEMIGLPVGEWPIRKALKAITWEGRLETVRQQPLVILDGAHNIDGIKRLSSFLKRYYSDKKKILIFGVMKDKEYQKMLSNLLPIMDRVVITRPAMERALPPKELKGIVKEGLFIDNMRDALGKAKEMAGADDLIMITGSLFTVAEAKRLIDEVF